MTKNVDNGEATKGGICFQSFKKFGGKLLQGNARMAEKQRKMTFLMSKKPKNNKWESDTLLVLVGFSRFVFLHLCQQYTSQCIDSLH